MVKVSKYSIKSEAAIHVCAIKKLFWRVLEMSQKNIRMSFFSSKVAGLYSLKRFMKKAPVHVFFCKFCQIF